MERTVKAIRLTNSIRVSMMVVNS